MSQSTKILKLIRTYPKFHFGKGVPNYKLSDVSLKYSSRIDELRKDGHNIIAERDYAGKRASNTFRYYLIEDNND